MCARLQPFLHIADGALCFAQFHQNSINILYFNYFSLPFLKFKKKTNYNEQIEVDLVFRSYTIILDATLAFLISVSITV